MSRKTQSNFGLNISDLYAPHINALKTMNKSTDISNPFEPYQDDQTTDPDGEFGHTYEDDDLYDFSNVKPSLNLENGSNNPTDDEDEDDINFDYAYGYDYDRVIKERLKIANQVFTNEPSIEKDRPVLVQFDNAVTAFDIPKEQDGTEVEKKEEPETIKQLPLNDTVEKNDSFANKIKEAIQRYDEEMAKMSQQEESTANETGKKNQDEDDDDVDEYFANLSNRNQSAALVKNSTPSPPSRNSPEISKLCELKFISKIVGIVSDEKKSKSPSPILKTSPEPDDEQVLVEKDGKFQLVTRDEYTALEQERKLNQDDKENKKPLIPHPPSQRPKTTSSDFRKNKILKDKIDVKRVSRSADVNKSRPTRTKSHSPIVKHTTPEYAKDYKSPYQAVRSVKPTETAEARKKRLEEEEERKRVNKEAFEAWLKLKEKQRLEDQKKKQNSDKKSTENSKHDESKQTFETWLQKKREQFQKEREYQKKLEQIVVLDKRKSSPEQRSKAFKDWITRKIREKNEVTRQEKLEHKKWLSRRRKSRKHQRLSQALEMANAYGYNSSYFTPGFSY